jgi:hypothetical protein
MPTYLRFCSWINENVQDNFYFLIRDLAFHGSAAPGAFPQGCPRVPPPNCNTESSGELVEFAEGMSSS